MSRLTRGRALLSEVTLFARQNRVYWIVPLILLLLLTALVIFGAQTAAPFIYPGF
jgi:hypothetical protein